MPIVKLKHIVSCSSEDKVHPATNLLKGSNADGKWRGEKKGEKQISVIMQLERSTAISSLDIGNDGAAYVEVLVGRSSGAESYQVLLVASSFMSPVESRNGTSCNRVRMFDSSKLSSNIAEQKWDLVKIVCTQPFNKHTTYGLNFINFHTTEHEKDVTQEPQVSEAEKTTKVGSEAGRITFGGFKLKKEVTPYKPPRPTPLVEKSLTRTIGSNDGESLSKKRKLEQTTDVTSVTTTGTSRKSSSKITLTKRVPVHSESPRISSNTSSKRSSQTALKSDTPADVKRGIIRSTAVKFNEILKNVVFAISGFQNPVRGEIREKALSMGAQYRRDWVPGCTHLICAFRNTPKYHQVMGTGGYVVRADWIKDCAKEKKRLPWKQYSMNPNDTSDDEEQDESNKGVGSLNNPYDESTDEEEGDDPDTEDEIERILRKQKSSDAAEDTKPSTSNKEDEKDPYDDSTDEEANGVDIDMSQASHDLPSLPDYFQGRMFYLQGDFGPGVERLLRRHILTCNGSIANYMEDAVNYVISDSDWLAEFDEALAENSSLLFLRPLWVFKCGQMKRSVPCQPYEISAS